MAPAGQHDFAGRLRIDQLTFEIAQLKRQKFGTSSERFGAEQ